MSRASVISTFVLVKGHICEVLPFRLYLGLTKDIVDYRHRKSGTNGNKYINCGYIAHVIRFYQAMLDAHSAPPGPASAI